MTTYRNDYISAHALPAGSNVKAISISLWVHPHLSLIRAMLQISIMINRKGKEVSRIAWEDRGQQSRRHSWDNKSSIVCKLTVVDDGGLSPSFAVGQVETGQ